MNSSDRKYSLGIACVRIRDNKPEVLMVRKRYTYAFFEFVLGKYKFNIDQRYRGVLDPGLMRLFDAMTIEEKLDILSLDFDKIWYRVWLSQDKSESYRSHKAYFDYAFASDNGAYLHELISNSKNGQYVWEMPKGRRMSQNEMDLTCAIREFTEETGVPKRRFRIIPGLKRTFSHTDDGVEYNNTYYVALANCEFDVSINFDTSVQVSEIGDIRWMSIEAVRVVDFDNRSTEFIRSIFRAVKKITKIST